MPAPFRVSPGDDANAMQQLVQDGTCALVRGVGAYTHPAAVGTFGSRHSGVIADRGRHALDGGEVVPVVHCTLHCFGDTLHGSGISTFADAVTHVSFGDGVEFDDVTIAHLASLGDGIRAHII